MHTIYSVKFKVTVLRILQQPVININLKSNILIKNFFNELSLLKMFSLPHAILDFCICKQVA